MRIGMLMKWKVPPMNVRVANEAETLSSAGHEVYFLIEGRRGEPPREKIGKVEVVRGVRRSWVGEVLNRYTFNFTFRDKLWARAIELFVRENSIDVIQVNDLPLMREGVIAARRFGIPVVADLHENYPAGLQVWYTNRLKKMTIYSYDRWSRYEREVLPEVDAVIVVIEEARARLEALGIPREKIIVVPNTVGEGVLGRRIDSSLVDRYGGRFVLCYVGGFAPHRGLDVVIRALRGISETIPEVILLLVGGGDERYRRKLQRLARNLDCEGSIEWTGWQPQDAIWRYIDASDICIVPHARNPHTDTTIPNKVFQYLARARPVIVSNCIPLRRIAEETGGGVAFQWDDPLDLEKRVIELYNDPCKRKAMGENGRRVVLERFTWEKTSEPLIHLYRNLEARRKD